MLRGIFLLRRKELEWFYQRGREHVVPGSVARSSSRRSRSEERGDLLAAYHRRLLGGDPARQLAAARAWSVWEGATSSLWPNPERTNQFAPPEFALALARIEAHYFVNRGFLSDEDQLLDGVDAHSRHSGRDRAGALRRRLSDARRRGSCTSVGRRPTSASCRRRAFGLRAGHHRRAHCRDGPIPGYGVQLMTALLLVNAKLVNEGPNGRDRRAGSRETHRASRCRCGAPGRRDRSTSRGAICCRA